MAGRMNRVPSEQTRARSVSLDNILQLNGSPVNELSDPMRLLSTLRQQEICRRQKRIPPGNWGKDGSPGYARAARRN